jgi:hypothetical protein
MRETPRFTQQDYDSLARAVPEYDGWHEIEWSEEEIGLALEALAKIRALIGVDAPQIESGP